MHERLAEVNVYCSTVKLDGDKTPRLHESMMHCLGMLQVQIRPQ